jgi:hypothetical protein
MTTHSPEHSFCGPQAFDLRRELYRIARVDLTDIPGVSTLTAQVILTEIGPNVSRFRNASAFCVLARPLPRKANQRRQGTFVQDTKGKEPGSDCTSARSPLTLSRKRLLWRPLSPYACQTRSSASYHRHLTRWHGLFITSSGPRHRTPKRFFTSATIKLGNALKDDSEDNLRTLGSKSFQ